MKRERDITSATRSRRQLYQVRVDKTVLPKPSVGKKRCQEKVLSQLLSVCHHPRDFSLEPGCV